MITYNTGIQTYNNVKIERVCFAAQNTFDLPITFLIAPLAGGWCLGLLRLGKKENKVISTYKPYFQFLNLSNTIK